MDPSSSRRRRKKKRRSNELVDRISSLPDGVLLHILSFLDMRHAVRTGILSSRWRGLWASTQSLDFEEFRYYEIDKPTLVSHFDVLGRDDFLKFVEHSLVLHLSSKIHKFRLCFCYKREYDRYMDGWILFAVKREVKQLYLEFPYYERDKYWLPSLRCESLISLYLKGCEVQVSCSLCFSSLVSLIMSHVDLDNDSIPALLDGCPLLEDLVLDACDFLDNLVRISSSSASGLPLKRLTIVYCTNSNDLHHIDLEIEAPNLEILNLYGLAMYETSLLKNVFSLREVYLEICPKNYVGNDAINVLESWLMGLYHVKVLKLSRVCIEVLSTSKIQPSYISKYISKTKCLILESELQRSELRGIAILLCHSHDLENLIIKLIPSRFVSLDPNSTEVDSHEELWEGFKFSCPCMVSRLMTVKIYGFMGRECLSAIDGVDVRSLFEKQDKEIELVRFFLKHAVALKKMTIQFCEKPDFVKEEEWLKILLMVAQKLTAIPRCSCVELSLVYKY